MPDAQGNVTAGQDDVQNNPSPVNPSQANIPGVGDKSPAIAGAKGPTAPTQQPQFFRRLLFALGKGLLEGTQAGLQAPMNAQGPSVAAANEPNIATQEMQRQAVPAQLKNQAELDRLKVETATVNLAILHHTLTNVADERVDGYYKAGQKFANDLMEKGAAEPQGTGKLKDIQDLLIQKRQLNPNEHYIMYPNPGATRGGEQEYTLLKYDPKGTFSEDVDPYIVKGQAITTPDGAKIQYPDVKIPGAKKGDRIDQWNVVATTRTKLAGLQDNDLSKAMTVVSREQEGAKNRSSRELIAEKNRNNSLRRDAIRSLQQSALAADRNANNALGKFVSASTAYDKLLDEMKNKGEHVLTGSEARSVDEAKKTRDTAKEQFDTMVAKTGGAIKPGSKGPITPEIAAQYMQKAGGDPKKAATLARTEGYVVPKGLKE